MSLAPDREAQPNIVRRSESRPCHIVDEYGRTRCGTLLRDARPHDLGECFAAGHLRCSVCEEMDGGMVFTTDGDWLK